MPIAENQIKNLFNEFKNSIESQHRYASYDYCFGYFHSFENKTDIANDENIEMSCLQLGFYLASWGMLRGSGFLLQKSFPFYKEMIKIIAEDCDKAWKIDVDNYLKDDNIENLKDTYKKLANCIPEGKKKIIIVTKIMLGVFGCCPAFDKYFCDTFRKLYGKESKFRSFNKEALETIEKFYKSNTPLIDELAKKCKVLYFDNKRKKELYYTKAKVIDMIGFQLGFENAIEEKKKKKKNKKKH